MRLRALGYRAWGASYRMAPDLWVLGALSALVAVTIWWDVSPGSPFGAFESASSLNTLLGTVAATLGGILGTVVAVVLVALEILRGRYAGHAMREVFRLASLRYLLTVYVFTITVSLLALGLVGNTVSPRAIRLTYLVLLCHKRT